MTLHPPPHTAPSNVDPAEVHKFDQLAADWWNPKGQSKPLHLLNPVRLQFIQQCTALEKQPILDIGCGGGILSEAMATLGGHVTGIDMSEAAIRVAQAHAAQNQLTIEYIHTATDAFAVKNPQAFSVITCMELLEHVPDPQQLIHQCSQLLAPNGAIFFSTLNRTLKAYFTAILGAEYLLNLLPKGTHRYDRFIRPSELRQWLSAVGLRIVNITGVHYSPLSGHFSLSQHCDVNYIVHCQQQ